MIKIKVNTTTIFKEILGQSQLVVSMPKGSSVLDLLSKLTKDRGNKLARLLFHPDSNKILPYIRVGVNGKDIELLNGPETLLKDNDEVLILPPAAGG